jgi:hypothetical protein
LSPGGALAFERRHSIALTFVGWSRVGSRRCAVLEVGGDAWYRLPEEARLGEIEGPGLTRGVYFGTLYFDVEAGRLVRGEVELGRVGQVTGRAGALDFVDQARWTFELAE